MDDPSSSTVYTFQVTMNGHNAALMDAEYNDYKVPKGQLTP